MNSPGTGALFVMSAPSGAGKTTLANAVRKRYPELRYSVSTTTRAPRPGEKDGVDYFFTDAGTFEQGIEEGRWAEWARVHGNYYGTSAEVITNELAAGHCLLLDIDVQGARQIVERFPQAVTIFILPPGREELRRRLESRGSDSPEVVQKRLESAEWEMEQADEYRYRVVNDDLDRAVRELSAIIERHGAACLGGS
ncbi:MAG: guanylate kinase [Desulfatibacillaceae bacterium]